VSRWIALIVPYQEETSLRSVKKLFRRHNLRQRTTETTQSQPSDLYKNPMHVFFPYNRENKFFLIYQPAFDVKNSCCHPLIVKFCQIA
jgi:hypothetical protein